jgi:hypothetical protein
VRPKHTRTRKKAKDAGYRSGFEHAIALKLKADGVEFEYESVTVKYPVIRSYKPDFILPNGIIVEAKGRFTGADRSKHLAVRKEHPELDIRFVFQANNTYGSIGKRYSDWCDQHGFEYAFTEIPGEWYEQDV